MNVFKFYKYSFVCRIKSVKDLGTCAIKNILILIFVTAVGFPKIHSCLSVSSGRTFLKIYIYIHIYTCIKYTYIYKIYIYNHAYAIQLHIHITKAFFNNQMIQVHSLTYFFICINKTFDRCYQVNQVCCFPGNM